MDNFNPVFWSVYVFMAFFLGFMAWEIIKMLIAVITGKFIKEDREKKAQHSRHLSHGPSFAKATAGKEHNA